MNDHLYLLDQFYTAQTALLAAIEVGTEAEKHECALALKHINKALDARKALHRRNAPKPSFS